MLKYQAFIVLFSYEHILDQSLISVKDFSQKIKRDDDHGGQHDYG